MEVFPGCDREMAVVFLLSCLYSALLYKLNPSSAVEFVMNVLMCVWCLWLNLCVQCTGSVYNTCRLCVCVTGKFFMWSFDDFCESWFWFWVNFCFHLNVNGSDELRNRLVHDSDSVSSRSVVSSSVNSWCLTCWELNVCVKSPDVLNGRVYFLSVKRKRHKVQTKGQSAERQSQEMLLNCSDPMTSDLH